MADLRPKVIHPLSVRGATRVESFGSVQGVKMYVNPESL
jgi:hypothetical protein